MPDFDGSELEFWIGAWAVSWGTSGAGTNRIERILGGHVLHEQFEGRDENDGLVGESWSVFDSKRNVWRQTWVDDQGGYLELVGGRVDDWFAFEREAPEVAKNARQRMVFRDVTPGAFRWTWESSPDAGTTWQTRWEIAYRRS